MNTSNVKKYAPKARKAFIDAMSKQAAKYGISDKQTESAKRKGNVVLIGDRPFPASIIKSRDAFISLVEQMGYEQAIDKVAYSWFNRLCALRYMELHDYLEHGRRVLSHPEEPTGFQLLDDCLDVELPGLDKALVRELKLDGTKDEELYRELLLAQCRALHYAMPFLFEPVDHATELLLPENLTKTDSLIHDLVTDIPEIDWQSIEIIGWLYQFYISEKKDEVIGKVVRSEDIPAATQLFTPNWIVKYMVQNSLGAQWLTTYPHSPLKEQMDYYIKPAEQTEEVNVQLKATTPENLNPEKLTFIDPASGSGHILVEAYELFKAIYLERGYRLRDVPRLILRKNLFGLDIDERSAQLTGFALMMKGRADDRRLFECGVKLNVRALVDSVGFDTDSLAEYCRHSHESTSSDKDLLIKDCIALKQLFEHARTFGSLIDIPTNFLEKLPGLKQLSGAMSQDLFVSKALKSLGALVNQAEFLAGQYDAVVANPPYMGSKYQPPLLKEYLKKRYQGYEKDFFSAFVVRSLAFAKPSGRLGFVTPYVWMFLSSYKRFRTHIVQETNLSSLIQLEYNAFEPACIPVSTFTVERRNVQNFTSSFIKLSDFKGHQNQAPKTLEAILDPNCGWFYRCRPDSFRLIPGSPVAYWLSEAMLATFAGSLPMRSVSEAKKGLTTGNNERFIMRWMEVDRAQSAFDNEAANCRYFPHLKGGGYRKWYGNHDFVLRYSDQDRKEMSLESGFRGDGIKYFFNEGVTWSDITSGAFSARVIPKGCYTFNNASPSAFYSMPNEHWGSLGLVNSNYINAVADILNPSLHFNPGDYAGLPLPTSAILDNAAPLVIELVELSKIDWDAYERSWDFQSFPLLYACTEPKPTLESSYSAWIIRNQDAITEVKRIEEKNNRLFIEAYGLQDELIPDVPIAQITLTVNPAYRYGGKLEVAEQLTRFRQNTMEELVSYAIGCMMGRYSLDVSGLIYAQSGNDAFDASKYNRFPADDDGIMPLTDKEWYEDDAANRLFEFIAEAWEKTHLETNLRFLADNLSPKKAESSRDTLRRYLCDRFFKDHLQTYKKRPIYWLFSSGKLKSFQCLVYLHRYNEGTLARMRTQYVIPLTAKMTAHVQKLENDKEVSDSAAEVKRLEKEIVQLHKKQAELSEFDEKLRRYTDQRITLDLDDGVKVNYGKFGDLLAEVKAITGRSPEATL